MPKHQISFDILKEALSGGSNSEQLKRARQERLGRLQQQAFGDAEFELFTAAEMQFPIGRESIDASRTNLVNKPREDFSARFISSDNLLRDPLRKAGIADHFSLPINFGTRKIGDRGFNLPTIKLSDQIELNVGNDIAGATTGIAAHEFRHRSDEINRTKNTPQNRHQQHKDIYNFSLLESEPSEFDQDFSQAAWMHGDINPWFSDNAINNVTKGITRLRNNQDRLTNRVAESAFNQKISLPNIDKPTIKDYKNFYKDKYDKRLKEFDSHLQNLVTEEKAYQKWLHEGGVTTIDLNELKNQSGSIFNN